MRLPQRLPIERKLEDELHGELDMTTASSLTGDEPLVDFGGAAEYEQVRVVEEVIRFTAQLQ